MITPTELHDDLANYMAGLSVVIRRRDQEGILCQTAAEAMKIINENPSGVWILDNGLGMRPRRITWDETSLAWEAS